MKFNIPVVFCMTFCVAIAGFKAAAQKKSPPSPYGTFSNLHFIEEAGDVLGLEITIVPQYVTPYAIFQCAEGSPTAPQFVPVEMHGNKIKFTIDAHDSSCDGVYTATITRRGFEFHATALGNSPLDFDSGILPRRPSYWSRRKPGAHY